VRHSIRMKLRTALHGKRIYAQSDALLKPPSRKSSPWSQVPGTHFLECVLQRLEALIQLYMKVMVLKLCFNPYLSHKGDRRIQESLHVCMNYPTLGYLLTSYKSIWSILPFYRVLATGGYCTGHSCTPMHAFCRVCQCLSVNLEERSRAACGNGGAFILMSSKWLRLITLAASPPNLSMQNAGDTRDI
jgi:hypothetical protein